jgi:pilus assembly protein FimV
VQTKFDLAKAYQEMGDKEGAREILQEVIAEGDPEQKAAARKVLETLA